MRYKISVILQRVFLVCCMFVTSAAAAIAAPDYAEVAPADSIPEPETIVRFQTLSNHKKKLTIQFTVAAHQEECPLNEIQAMVNDTLLTVIAPISVTRLADSVPDVWEVTAVFPYRARFKRTDHLILTTTSGSMCLRFPAPDWYFSSANSKQPEVKDSLPHSAVSVWWIVALILTVIGIGVGLYFRQRFERNKESRRVDALFDDNRRQNEELRSKIDALYAGRVSTLNFLCDEYYNKRDARQEEVRLSIYKEVEKQILLLKSPKSLAELENIVNTYLNDILLRIRQQIPSLSHTDIVFLTYLYAGFSPRAVCIFCDIKIKNFYNRRSRLRARILESGAPDAEIFASRM